MFNLTVDEAHTFYVGNNGWLVHNCDVYYPFDIVRYDTNLVQLNALRVARGLPKLEKHHGILDVWAKNNIPGYLGKEAPTIVLTDAQHQATKDWFNQWRIRETGSLTGRVDWAGMGPREAQQMANEMFNAAGIPQNVTDQYIREFTRYIYGK